MPRRRGTAPQEVSPAEPSRWPEVVVAALAFVLVIADLDPTGTYPWLPDGPGLTVDESFNVGQGARLEVGLREWVAGRITLRELFGTREDLGPNAPAGYHLPDHPTLLQTFVWQHYDLAPRFPELHRFLDFWAKNIEGKLHSVTVTRREIVGPANCRHAAGMWQLH